MAYIPLRKAVEFLGLHPNTLRKYADEGKISHIKNEAGQRLYDVESYGGAKMSGKSPDIAPSYQRDAIAPTLIFYYRVSWAKQRDDLARQVELMVRQYPDAEIVKDIGSGLNFKRKGLQALLVRLMRGDKLTIVIACRDRLCRFGFELFEFMVKQNGGQIMVLKQIVHCPETELTAALLAMLSCGTLREHVFSCRMHGLRRKAKKIKEDPTIPKP
jgi:putative resolvase